MGRVDTTTRAAIANCTRRTHLCQQRTCEGEVSCKCEGEAILPFPNPPQVKKFREYNAGKLPAAGAVQPGPVVSCHDLPSFVPVRQRILSNYSLMAPNL